MSKPDKLDKLTAIMIIQNAVDHYLSQPEYQELSDTVLAQIESYLVPLAKRKQALLFPAPAAPKKPRTRKPESKPAAMETVSSEPIARYEPSGEYVNPHERKGRAK